jgi:hypothetical protein
LAEYINDINGKHLVGVARFELATPSSRTTVASRKPEISKVTGPYPFSLVLKRSDVSVR